MASIPLIIWTALLCHGLTFPINFNQHLQAANQSNDSEREETQSILISLPSDLVVGIDEFPIGYIRETLHILFEQDQTFQLAVLLENLSKSQKVTLDGIFNKTKSPTSDGLQYNTIKPPAVDQQKSTDGYKKTELNDREKNGEAIIHATTPTNKFTILLPMQTLKLTIDIAQEKMNWLDELLKRAPNAVKEPVNSTNRNSALDRDRTKNLAEVITLNKSGSMTSRERLSLQQRFERDTRMLPANSERDTSQRRKIKPSLHNGKDKRLTESFLENSKIQSSDEDNVDSKHTEKEELSDKSSENGNILEAEKAKFRIDTNHKVKRDVGLSFPLIKLYHSESKNRSTQEQSQAQKMAQIYREMDSVTSCVHVDSYFAPVWLKMVVSCPVTWDNVTEFRFCQGWNDDDNSFGIARLTQLPVQDIHGVVYGNVYCAACNGARGVLPWQVKQNCTKTDVDLERELLYIENVDLLTNYLRRTHHCITDIAPVFPERLLPCNIKETLQRSLSFMKRASHHTSDDSHESPSYPVSFNVLLNFDFLGKSHMLFQASQQVVQDMSPRCRDWETFDPFIKSCRPISCSKYYIRVEDHCVRDPDASASQEDTITDLSQLDERDQPTLVTMRTKMPYDSCLSISLQANSPKVLEALASHVEISPDRVQHLKIRCIINFDESERIEKVDIQTLTEEEYLQHFPPLPLDFEESVVDQETEIRSGSENNASYQLATKAIEMKTWVEGKKLKPRPVHLPEESLQGEEENKSDRDIEKKDEHGSATSDQHFDDVSASPSNNYKDTFHHEKRENSSESVVKHSEGPVPTVETGTVSFNQSSILEITFVLVPPHGPTAEAATNGNVLTIKRIYQLMLDQRFSLSSDSDGMDEVKNTSTFCPWGMEYMVQGDEFVLVKYNDAQMMYINKTHSWIPMGKFDFFLSVSGSQQENSTNITNDNQFAFVCFMPRINQEGCNRIAISRHEYSFEKDESGYKTLLFEGNKYDMFAYEVMNETTGEIHICVPHAFEQVEQDVPSFHFVTVDSCGHRFDRTLRAEGLLTQILGRISICGLACVLVTYIIFSELRNLPGLNTMNLTLALFLAEITFSEGIDVHLPWLCEVVSISIHYMFLAAHFWMNVMSFDVYRTFSNSTLLKEIRDKRKYFPRYAIFAWGTPMIIVALCIIVEKTHIFPDLRIGYGGDVNMIVSNNTTEKNSSSIYVEGSCVDCDSANRSREEHVDDIPSGPVQLSYCWIREPLAALVAFGTPILVIFVVNCIFFGRTIANISNTTKLAKKSVSIRHSTSSLHKMTGRSDVMLYVRMSTVMGFTWILGLSSSILSSFIKPISFTACIVSHILSILFTIFNVTQGVFIFAVFVCNRRVFNLYTKLFLRMKAAVIKKSPKSKLYKLSTILSYPVRPKETQLPKYITNNAH